MTAFDWHNRYLQQALWTAQLRRYLYSKVQIKVLNRILDVGCGTGAILADSGLADNPVRYGLDINEQSLNLAYHISDKHKFCVGDGLCLPYINACFDLTYCHFYLLWVKDPGLALQEMKRVTRKGGFIIAMAEPDYEGRIDFPEKYRWIGQLQKKALEDQGANPGIGRHLSRMFALAGIKDIETGIMGGQWVHPNSSDSIKNEWAVLRQDLNGLVPETILHQFEEMDVLSWNHRERTIFVPTFYAMGQV